VDRRPRAPRRERPGQDVVNELVAVPTDGASSRGSSPRAATSIRTRGSPRTVRLCFLAWDLPWMPWDGCELHVATSARRRAERSRAPRGDGRRGVHLAARVEPGRRSRLRERSQRLVEPRADPERRATPLHPRSRVRLPGLVFGRGRSRSWGRRIVCGFEDAGFTRFGVLDAEIGRARALDSASTPGGRRTSRRRGAGRDPRRLADGADADRARRPRHGRRRAAPNEHGAGLPDGLLSVPVAIDFPTEGGLTAHASSTHRRTRSSRRRRARLLRSSS
jgi:hypothetical protein